MKIQIKELNQKVHDYLKLVGMNEHDTAVMTELIIEGEMIGNQFSPVGELPGKHTRPIENIKNGKEEVVVNKPSLQLIKGNGRLAPLITADHLDKIVKKAIFLIPSPIKICWFLYKKNNDHDLLKKAGKMYN